MPTSPVKTGALVTGGYAYGVAVGGDFAYVADGWEGLKIVSVTDRAHRLPGGRLSDTSWFLGWLCPAPPPTWPTRLAGCAFINVSDAASPTEVNYWEMRM